MKKKYACYYCGKRAKNWEHVPPKHMFKAFQCDSITVPSCKKHNNSKGNTDQTIVSALMRPLYNGRNQYNWNEDVKKAVEAGSSSFERTKRKVISGPIIKNIPPGLEGFTDGAYVVPDVDIKEWMKQLTAALVYDGTKQHKSYFFDPDINWNQAEIWSPHTFFATGPASLSAQQLRKQIDSGTNLVNKLGAISFFSGWGPYPKTIYDFQLIFTREGKFVFKHIFYSSYEWYVVFKSSKETTSRLLAKLETLSK